MFHYNWANLIKKSVRNQAELCSHFTYSFYRVLHDIMIYWKIGEITPILHCKIIQQFCNFFLLFLISMHQKPHIFHLCGYLQHIKLFLANNNAV